MHQLARKVSRHALNVRRAADLALSRALILRPLHPVDFVGRRRCNRQCNQHNTVSAAAPHIAQHAR